MKTAKKVLCLMLCVALMAGTFCTAASAAEWSGKTIFDPGFAAKQDGEFLYVAVGDSASMGYDMDDFDGDFQHVFDVVRGEEASNSSRHSVYTNLCNYLAETAGIENLVTKDLSMTGMRPLELRSLLDKSYYDAHFDEIKPFDKGGTFWGYHMDEYLTSDGRHGYKTYENINKTYTEFLYNADLITIDLTMNDFGTYLGQRFQAGDIPNYANETLAKVLAEGNYPKVAEAAESLKAVLEEILAKVELPLDAATIEGYLDMFLYCFANFAINFSKIMDLIYTNNPDAQVIVVGPYNIMEGVNFVFGDVTLDVSSIWKALDEAQTAYICAVDPHRNQYKFADMSGGCETMISAIADGRLYNELYANAKHCYFKNGDQGLGFEDLFDGIYGGVYGAYISQSAPAEYAAAAAAEAKGECEALVKNNIQKTANITDIPLMDVMELLSGDLTAIGLRVMLNYDNDLETATKYATMLDAVEMTGIFFDDEGQYIPTTDAEKAMMHVALRFVTSYALGSHPTVDGYVAKNAAVQKAYEKDYAADGTYMARVVEKTVDSSIGFIGHLFNVIMGRESLADLKAYVLSIFQPMLKVFDLAGSFGLC